MHKILDEFKFRPDWTIGGARWRSGRVSDSEREVGGSKPTAAVLCP